jgi:hypothetical protein
MGCYGLRWPINTEPDGAGGAAREIPARLRNPPPLAIAPSSGV